jgi:SAM-dependent methyltransferase
LYVRKCRAQPEQLPLPGIALVEYHNIGALNDQSSFIGNCCLMNAKDCALLALGKELQAHQYHFTTITPSSHRRVNDRVSSSASSLEQMFGWNRAVRPKDLPNQVVALLDDSGELEGERDLVRSKVRFSTLGEQLFVHSGYPTNQPDAVFFGPDTYRFARWLRQSIAATQPRPAVLLIDIGSGCGAGGFYAANILRACSNVEVILADINPKALRYGQVNARLNGIGGVRTALSDVFAQLDERADLIISNPPYLVDKAARLYRHGGGELGFDLSLRIVEDGIDHLRPGGRLLLYTGTPIINGTDPFLDIVRARMKSRGCAYTYEEIDPDVFGEELDDAPYDRADRIAVVALTIHAME